MHQTTEVRRVREGVTANVNRTMDAVDADVLCEDGLLLRTCEHGVRHPVGHLHRALTAGDDKRHELPGAYGINPRVACCAAACCAAWGGAVHEHEAEKIVGARW